VYRATIAPLDQPAVNLHSPLDSFKSVKSKLEIPIDQRPKGLSRLSVFVASALFGLVSIGIAESPLHASTSDSDLKKALLNGTQVKGQGCHASGGVTGYLEFATSPTNWVKVNDILGWYPYPGCPSATPFGPWTIGSVPKGAIMRWTVSNPQWSRSYSSDPLEIYAGPDPIPASGIFELKSGCYQRGLLANLEWKKSDGTWSIVSDAKGWDEISSCPSSVPVRPWTATLMTLSPGTEYRWNIYFPGIWSLYSDTETIPYPPTTTTTSTIAPRKSASEKVITCQTKTSRIRVIGKNPKCPSGFKAVKKP